MNNVDAHLVSLFELEREAQCQAMKDSLLALEKSPGDSSQLERLMRAAHSLKGAAKLVGSELVVQQAHFLESSVVSLQQENRVVSSIEFDQYFELIAAMSGKEREIKSSPSGNNEPNSSQFARVELSVMDSLLRLAGEILVQQNRLQLEDVSNRGTKNFIQKMAAIFNSALMGGELDPSEAIRQSAHLLRDFEAQVQASLDSTELANNRSFHLAQRLYRETLRSRMRPLSDISAPLPEFCRSVSRSLSKETQLVLNNQDTLIDRDLLKQLEAPFQQLIKNAVDHGIESPSERTANGKAPAGTISIRAHQNSNTLTIIVADDGAGISPDVLREKIVQRGLATQEIADRLSIQELFEFIFLPGFSSRDQVTEYSGRGVGLDIVREKIRELRGTVNVVSELGRGTEFVITLPVSLSVMKILSFVSGGEIFAVPLVDAIAVGKYSPTVFSNLYGSPTLNWEGGAIPVVRAGSVFGTADCKENSEIAVVVIKGPQGPFALIVEDILGQEDVVVQPVDRRLQHLPFIAAVATLNRGAVVVIIDSDDIAAAIKRIGHRVGIDTLGVLEEDTLNRTQVLVVDDSLTVRELERKLLTDAGYEVTVALDGLDGLQQIAMKEFDLLVTDVDMPRMNGFELIEAVRANPRYVNIPTIVVSYKERPEDKRRGLECGADAYLTKGSFQDETFIETVKELLRR